MDHDSVIAEDAAGLTLTRLLDLGFDLAGLTVRAYGPADEPLLLEWWNLRHDPLPFPLVMLPPLGVVVEDAAGPAGMMWCYECYGVGVGFLEFATTRPGLSMRAAGNVLAYLVSACVTLAGRCADPPGEVRMFRTTTSTSGARFLKRLGFFSNGPSPSLRNLILHNA